MKKFDIAEGWPKGPKDEKALERSVTDLICNHTLLVGQSRSGKTNAARRIIEEVVATTAGRVVILDPNADFCSINELRHDEGGGPTVDVEEFRPAWESLKPAIAIIQSQRYERLGTAVRVLNFFEGNADVDRFLRDDSKRLIVFDLSMDDDNARFARAARALRCLWQLAQENRWRYNLRGPNEVRWQGVVLVVDEAHMFAPLDRSSRAQARVCERLERISDQGKKFNLHLMMISQQPNKLNARILGECNNRIVMRMNERLSLKVLEDTYGGQSGRYDGALTLEQGWALIEGALLSDVVPPDSRPRGIRFKRGRTKEGGGSADHRWVTGGA